MSSQNKDTNLEERVKALEEKTADKFTPYDAFVAMYCAYYTVEIISDLVTELSK